jgi:hypothetical protein
MLSSVLSFETWVHHYETAGKCQSMECKRASLSRTKKHKSVSSASKVMLTLFLDFIRLIVKHYQDCGQTINSAQYCAVFEDKFKPVVCGKCRGMLKNGVVLHHDNA